LNVRHKVNIKIAGNVSCCGVGSIACDTQIDTWPMEPLYCLFAQLSWPCSLLGIASRV